MDLRRDMPGMGQSKKVWLYKNTLRLSFLICDRFPSQSLQLSMGLLLAEVLRWFSDQIFALQQHLLDLTQHLFALACRHAISEPAGYCHD
jgi:hypothetical protein